MATGAVMVALSSFVPNPILTNEAFAQASTVTTMSASATVVNPLGLTPGQLVKFGKFAVKGAGKLGLTTAGAQSVISNVVLIGGATTQAGSVKITAPKSAAFVISVPTFGAAGPIKLAHSAKITGTATANYLMSITQLKMAAFTAGVPAAAVTFSNGNPTTAASDQGAAGFQTVALGGTLAVSAGQTPGVYTGTYQLLTTF